MKRIVIVGGGISGLAAAYRLSELRSADYEPFEICLLESGSKLGGVIRSCRREAFLLEGGPDAFLSEKPEAMALAHRLGLSNQLIETNQDFRRSFIVRGGKLRPVPEGFHLLAPSSIWSFLKSDIVSWTCKASMARDLFVSRPGTARDPNGDANADESLASFVRRRLGRQALERIAQPMIGGIYTADPEKLSLRATMPRFLEMERRHGSLVLAMRRAQRQPKNDYGQQSGGVTKASGARYSLFVSFADGMQTLIDQLAGKIAEAGFGGGDDVRLNTKVKTLTFNPDARNGRRWNLLTQEDEIIDADVVCVALPAHTTAKLLQDVAPSMAVELSAIPYASTATVNLAYRRQDILHPLNGFGFVVPFVERRTLLACTFSSVKFAGRAPEGHVLLRAFVGGALQPEMFELDDDEMVRCIRLDLSELLGCIGTPLFAAVEKWPRSMPQYHVGHLQRVARIETLLTSLPGLFLMGGAYHGPGIPDCIRGGESAALSAAAFLQTRS